MPATLRRSTLVLAAAFLPVLSACWGESGIPVDEISRLLAAIRTAEAELEIARNGKVYALLDTASGELKIKIGGATLKTIPAEAVHIPSSDACGQGVRILSEKAPVWIRPQADPEQPGLRATPAAMPARYSLALRCGDAESGIVIAPYRGTPTAGMRAAFERATRRLQEAAPFGAPAPWVFALDRSSAQELYWALEPGDSVLIR